jgi:FKBP-type peptidyl-prolyl cis-trans isomerase FkpA
MLKSLPASLMFAVFATSISYAAGAQDKPAAPAAPPVAAPTAAPAAELKIIDRQVGAGREVQSGRAALVQYTGWLYDDKAPENKGKQFDTSANRGLPFGFIVGVGKVIKGWDQGVLGMKVGGKRTLIIPPQLGYGDKDISNGLIPPNSTLLFDIELVEVKP